MGKFKRVLAICLKTYVDEDDMRDFCNGNIKEPCDVKVYHKGRKYKVVPGWFNDEYWKVID